MSDSVWPYGLYPARLLCPWDLQARILAWASMPSSRGSSWPRDQTCIYCFAGRFFTTEPSGKPSAMLKTKILINQNIFISLVPKHKLSMFFVWCIFLGKYWRAWLWGELPNSIGAIYLLMYMYVLYFKVQNCESWITLLPKDSGYKIRDCIYILNSI